MTREYTFYDYIDAGTNVISSWLNNDGKDANGYFKTLIPLLEASKPAGFKGSEWRAPHFKRMKGEWEGFVEFRKTGGVQYRLIGQTKDRKIFLVACAIHKGQNFKTTIPVQTALTRVQQMENNLAEYGREHEYN